MRSVLTPLLQARNSTLFYYDDNTILPGLKSLLDNRSIHEELLSPICKVCFKVCFLYFCRIRELLNATVKDVVAPDRLVLHGVKKSNSYVIYLPNLSFQVSHSISISDSSPIFPISYSKLYRAAVRVGISHRSGSSRNVKRLHAARYIFSSQSVNSIHGSELAGVLRHRGLSSYSSYL